MNKNDGNNNPAHVQSVIKLSGACTPSILRLSADAM